MNFQGTVVALLIGAVLIGAGGVPVGDADATNSGGPVATTSWASVERVERKLRRCTNAHREANGLRPLWARRALNRAAHIHARNMARHHFFDHVDQKSRDTRDRVALFQPREKFVAIGENIAAGQRTARAACRAWMNSSGHRAVMLGPYNRIGGGFARGGPYRRYFVLVFARAR